MLFNLIFLIPQIFTVGQDIVDCLDGKVDQATWDRTVEDMYQLAIQIPELKGILAMNQSLFMLAKMVFPFVQQLNGLLHGPEATPQVATLFDDPLMSEIKKFLEGTKEMTEQELNRAHNSVKLLFAVSEKIAEKEGVEKIELDNDSVLKYYENKFNTGTFYDNPNV